MSSSSHVVDSNTPRSRRIAVGADEATKARNRIGNIVFSARSMIDRVASTARRAPLQGNKLRQHARVIQKIYLPRIYRRQRILVEIGLRFLGGLVLNPMDAKTLTHPSASITIAGDRRDFIALEHLHKFVDALLRRKRRASLADRVENNCLFAVDLPALQMTYRQRHRVRTSARRIGKREIPLTGDK